jgi:hypothetical protein
VPFATLIFARIAACSEQKLEKIPVVAGWSQPSPHAQNFLGRAFHLDIGFFRDVILAVLSSMAAD